MIVIFLIVLLLFGAKKIPELARGVGKGMGEFKKAKKDFEREIKEGEFEGEREWDRDVKSSTDTGKTEKSADIGKSEKSASSASKD
ncbi:MAG: twin-arginine translocase TatA/TatE family subunit [Verrucomicrobiales bacterium]